MGALVYVEVPSSFFMNVIDTLRQFRIAGYAVFDFLVAFLAIYLVAPYLQKLFLKVHVDIPRVSWMYLTIPIALGAHLAIGRMTPLTEQFLDLQGHYVIKLLVLVFVVLAIRNMRIV